FADRLERSNEELQMFAYVASHDLQEPLRMVASYLGLLERRYRGALDADADRFIHYAVDGALRMRALINDLLAYSRVDSQRRRASWVDTAIVVKRVAEDLGVAIKETGAVLTVDPLPAIVGDEGQLRQLFQNLIGNAVKFQPLGNTPRVRISAERQG